jgi:hypothetical protein
MVPSVVESYPDAEVTAKGDFVQVHLSIGGSLSTKK